MEMGSQGPGRRRVPNRERLSAEDDALNQIAREAEARLAAKRAARAEAREIRMKELERQQKEIYQVQKKYYGLDTKFGDIEQWMEDSERFSRRTRRYTSASDEDERMSVGSRGSLRSDLECAGAYGRAGFGKEKAKLRSSKAGTHYSDLAHYSSGLSSKSHSSSLNGNRDSLAEVEEKYRKAMVSNAQLDNEKTNLMYQVDTLKDALVELEEHLAETRRDYEEKCKEFERQKHAYSILQFQFNEIKESLQQREEMLTEIRQLQQKQESFIREISDLQETIEWKDKKIGALERQKEFFDTIRSERDELRDEVTILRDTMKSHGIVLGMEVTTNGEIMEGLTDGEADSESRVPQETSQALPATGDRLPDIKVKKLIEERESLLEQIKELKANLDDKQKSVKMEKSTAEDEVLENGTDAHVMDLQRDANRQISDLKFKLVKAEQEITALEQNAIRLEGQVLRYKGAAESAEKVEDELKAEKRKLQRELRTALDKVEELEVSNSHLTKRLEKMKAIRSAILAQQ
uniref:LRR binding FLII interacting protein 1 n=1 Tax=Latimeria chalumnae TaxID=7897 RepID=H3ALX1_LATCH